jgi:hypothetical protein
VNFERSKTESFWVSVPLSDVLYILSLLASVFHFSGTQMDRDLKYWQEKLHLKEWLVIVVQARGSELDANTVGDIIVFPESKSAVVRILREHDSDLPPRQARADQELTLMHEMVHLQRMAVGDATWQDEGTTNQEMLRLLRANHRWRELSAMERQ